MALFSLQACGENGIGSAMLGMQKIDKPHYIRLCELHLMKP